MNCHHIHILLMETLISSLPPFSLPSSLPLSLSLAYSLLLLCMYVFPWQFHPNTAVKMVKEGDLTNVREDG